MTTWPIRRVRAEAVGPLLALHAEVLRLDTEGRPTPCRTDPDPFTSDRADVRARAAQACALCPARRPCRLYAEAQGERAHVWAGRDRTPANEGGPR